MKHPMLSSLDACREGAAFAEQHETLEAAWLACDRPDWLLWFAGRRKVERKTIVRIACEIARLALPYAKDPCVLECIEVAERWIDDKATLEEVREARRAAADAADAAAAYAAAYAADAACAAAYAADADANAYTDAASDDAAAEAAADAAAAAEAAADAAAAAAAYAAAYAADAAGAREKTKAQCCAIIRKHLPTLPGGAA